MDLARARAGGRPRSGCSRSRSGILLVADLAASTARNFDTDIAPYLGAAAGRGVGAVRPRRAASPTRDLRIEPRPDTTPDHPARSVLIGVALLMGPVAAVVGDLSTVDGMVMIGACSTVLALGVMARFVNLVHQNQRAHAATAISERRFRMLADSAPVGIFELARGMRVTYANAEGSRLLGDGVIGGSVDEMLANVDRGQPRLVPRRARRGRARRTRVDRAPARRTRRRPLGHVAGRAGPDAGTAAADGVRVDARHHRPQAGPGRARPPGHARSAHRAPEPAAAHRGAHQRARRPRPRRTAPAPSR